MQTFKTLITSTLLITALGTSSMANAAIVSVDWQTTGDNYITQITGTGVSAGLEWLDLTVTAGRSYNDISSKFGVGQEFDGWRYATAVEVTGFFDAFGGDSNYYNAWSTQNNGLFDKIAPLWGDLYINVNGGMPGDGYSRFVIADVNSFNFHWSGQIYDFQTNTLSANEDLIIIFNQEYGDISISSLYGSALIRTTPVPVPAAAWLFGSGLIGLIGIARRKRRA